MTFEKQWNGLLTSRTREMRAPDSAPCPMCKGKGSLNALARIGRNRLVMCNRCCGTGNAAAEKKAS